MLKSMQASQPPCLCRRFHVDCSPQTCPQAQHASKGDWNHYTIRTSRESAAGTTERPPCSTCAAVVLALTEVGEVRQVLRDTIEDLNSRGGEGMCEGAADDYEMMLIELDVPVHALATVPSVSPSSSGTEVGDHEVQEGGGAARRIIRTCASKEDSVNWRHFNIWRDQVDGVGGNGCRALPPLMCHPVVDTGSDAATEQLKVWIRTCDEAHGCVPSQTPSRAPTRLVQLSDDEVRVVRTHGKSVRYTTLSHRWGKNEDFVLTKENMSAWSADNIPWHTIPRTYRDAIEVTRKLGVDFIWIDTMCIVQDDDDDWRHESTLMKAVYSGSYLSIAADCAADSHGGLFAESTLVEAFKTHEVPEEQREATAEGQLRIRQQPHFTHKAFGSNYSDISLLIGRAWVFQERLLAPRVVYYDQDELKWECHGGTECLCGGMLAISNFSLEYHESLGLYRGRKQPRHRDDDHGDSSQEKSFAIQRMRVIERYSTCLLTYDSDRMIALSGVAEQAHKMNRGGRYLAGHWERNMADQMCWQVSDVYRKPSNMYIAPSWSWLSVIGDIWFSNRMDFDCAGSEIDVRITQAEVSLADKGRETGPVTSGFIKVDGKVIVVEASIGYPGSDSAPQRFWLTHRETGTTLHYSMEADYIMPDTAAKDLKSLTLLYWGNIWENGKTFMVLRKAGNADEHEGKFEGLGTYEYVDGEEHYHEFNRLMEWSQYKEGLIIV